MNEVLKFVGACLNESSFNNASGKSDMATCILQYLFENFEEEFKAVADDNNDAVMKSKTNMEASQGEAVLHEAKIGKSTSHVLLRHLHQYFGKSLFASEKNGNKCFSGHEFKPTTKMYELPDKTKVNHWYKLTHEMLWHHAHFIFSHEDLCDVSSVDITVGRDHGKGKLIIKWVKVNHLLFSIYH
jgi:hypothetical protein